jgi:hypothetical protein
MDGDMRTIYSPIVQSTVESTLTLALRQAEEATMDMLQARRDQCRDFYHNEVLLEDGGKDEYLKNFFGRYNGENGKWEYRAKLLLEHVPLTEQLIDLKAKNYREQPARIAEDKPAEKYTDLLKRSGWFSTAKRIEQYMQLLSDVAVGVFLNEKTKLLQFAIIPSYIPIFAEDDPLAVDPVAIVYPTAKRTKTGNIIYAYYDADKYVELTKGGEIVSEQDNSYRVLNFIFAHRKKPVNSHFDTPRISLVLANQAIDVAMSSLNHLLHYNGFKQLVIIGDTAKAGASEFVLGNSQALLIAPSDKEQTAPSANVLDMQADFLSHVETIKFKFEAAANSINMNFQWKIEGGPQSGFALQVQNVRDTEDRQNQVEILDEFVEQPLFKIVSSISENFGLGIEKGVLTVDFIEPEVALSATDEIAWEKHLLETNQTNVVELMMEENPDLDEDEAARRLENNIKLNKLSSSGQALEADILAILEDEDSGQEAGLNATPQTPAGQAGQDQGSVAGVVEGGQTGEESGS